MKRLCLSSVFVWLVFFLDVFFLAPLPASEIESQNVVVLYNADQGPSGEGSQIAEYYSQARPGVQLVPISGINSILYGSSNDSVSADDYLSVIRPQVLSAINGIPESIDVIVTTKGMPLRIDAGVQPPGNTSSNWKRFSSLESELTRIDSIDSVEEMGDQFFYIGFPQIDPTKASNPYYNNNAPFVRAGSDPINGDIRLASRLDGYSVATVQASIDRAQKAFIVPFGHNVVADDTAWDSVDQMTEQGSSGTGPGPGLVDVFSALYGDDDDYSPLLYEGTNTAVTNTDRPVIGYVSHGTNDGGGGLTPGYIENQLQFELADGAVFLTHESFNAYSFDPAYAQPQGLIAEWLEIGGTAGLGHVSEPFNGPDNVTNEDLFYQMLLPPDGAQPGDSGLTFVEAAWNATRQLSYVNTVVGDPLMRWQEWLPGDANLDGWVNLDDLAILQINWLGQGDFRDGDFNGDGSINLDDLAVLQIHWLVSVDEEQGATASAGPIGTLGLDPATGQPVFVQSIPEPQTFLLLVFGAFLGTSFVSPRGCARHNTKNSVRTS